MKCILTRIIIVIRFVIFIRTIILSGKMFLDWSNDLVENERRLVEGIPQKNVAKNFIRN